MQVNLLTVLVGAIINMVVGALWYSPVLFSKRWMKLIGKTEKELKGGNMGQMYGTTFVLALVMAFFTAIVVSFAKATTLADGAMIGFMLWLGFVVATSASGYIFEGRPMKLWAINVGYYLVVLVLTGALFGAWH